MDINLLINMYYAAPELWYGIGACILLLSGIAFYQLFRILKLKQKNYFLNRDRERYAETLYASRDGYFAFIYPDQKINDPRKQIVERCSRRLAVMLNLSEGTKSSFDEVLKNFYKEDVKKIQKYIAMLKDEGVSFDDEFVLKNNNKFMKLSGSRINAFDGNIYCDMIWFRDVSYETNKIAKLEHEKELASAQLVQMEDLLNNIPYPVWLRDENLKLKMFNKKYAEYLNTSSKSREEIIEEGIEINGINGESLTQNLAFLAHSTNRQKKKNVSLVKNGQRIVMEATETPFHIENSLDKISTVGALIDITELDDLKRNLKIHENTQLEIFGTLGTAFAVFDQHEKLAFYNKAFATTWKLDSVWLEQQPLYSAFLDVIREKRLLPEVSDYTAFKKNEQENFSRIIEPMEDRLYLPNGKTFRRVIAPHHMGGLVFAYEDITDRIATTSAYNELLKLQKEMLENLFDAVLIFGSDGALAFYNQSYIKLWKSDRIFLDRRPNLSEVLDSQKRFFAKEGNWKDIKKNIINHIVDMTNKRLTLYSDELGSIEILSCTLSDGSMMITYQKNEKPVNSTL